MIALQILAFSMLGLSSVMLSTIETNRDARPVTAATNSCALQLEVLRGTAYSGVVVEPGLYARSLYGNREISSLASRGTGLARIGKARSRSR